MLLVSKLTTYFFGYFDPTNIFEIIDIHEFRVDLADASAKTKPLYMPPNLDGH